MAAESAPTPPPAAPVSAETTAPVASEKEGKPPVAAERPSPAPAAPASDAGNGKSLDEMLEGVTDEGELNKLLAQIDESDRAKKAGAPDKKPEPSKAEPKPEAKVASEPTKAEKPVDADDDDAPMRLWMKSLSPEDRALATAAVNMVRESQRAGGKMTIRQAFAKLSAGESAAEPAAPAAEETPQSPLALFDAEIKKQDDLLSDLRKQKKAARESYDDDKVDEINEQISDAKILKARLEERRAAAEQQETERTQNAEAEAAWNSGYHRARSIAKKILPDGETPGHPDFIAVTQEIHRLEQEDPEALQDPDYVIDVALAVAGRRRSAAPAANAEDDVVPPAAPRRGAREAEVPVVGAHATTTPPPTQQEIDEMLENLSPEEVERLADAIGTRSKDQKSVIRSSR